MKTTTTRIIDPDELHLVHFKQRNDGRVGSDNSFRLFTGSIESSGLRVFTTVSRLG